MKIYLFLILGLTLHCTSTEKSSTEQLEPLNIQNKTYVSYYDGEVLNSITFTDFGYVYMNGEMETTEKGIISKIDSVKRQVLIRQDLIIHVSGLEEKDSTYFLLDFPTDTTLVHSKRIQFNRKSEKYDTLNLSPYTMYLKK